MRGHLFQRLVVFEIVGKLGAFLLLAGNHTRGHAAIFTQRAAQTLQQAGVLGKAFHKNVLGAVQRRLDVSHTLVGVDKGCGLLLGIKGRIIKQSVGERLQTGLNGNLALGTALGLVGQVQVFKAGFGVGLADIALQFGAQLTLLGDARQHRAAAVFQLTQITQALFQITQLGVVQTAGYLLAITGNKRNAGPLVQQGDRCGDLLGTDRQLAGDARGNTLHGETLPLIAKTGRAV